MKISKKQNRILLGLAIAALVAIFFYQVAYATNESSYKFGYSWNTVWSSGACTNGDGDCADTGVCTEFHENVTNATACVDGFVDGWLHFCGSNLELCAKFVMSGVFPGHIDGKGWFPYVCFRTYEGIGPDNILTPSSHCPPIQCAHPGCVHR